jgi:hypothetical protein
VVFFCIATFGESVAGGAQVSGTVNSPRAAILRPVEEMSHHLFVH